MPPVTLVGDCYAAVPAELRAVPRWIGYRLEPDPKHPEKPRKTPKQPRRQDVNASSTDPATWSSFAQAVAARAWWGYDGIGFVLGDGWVGADFDHCVDEDGEIAADVLAIVRQLDSYTEFSPSGTGLHVLMRGSLPEGRRKRGNVELYDGGRYFTVTGRHVEGTPCTVEDRTDVLQQLHPQLFPAAPAPDAVSPAGANQHTPIGVPSQAGAAARRANAVTRFAALWSGDTTGYPSGSEADLALCGYLADWTGGDAAKMDAMFRRSGLFRAKWDEHRNGQTYGQRTIARALS